MIKKQILWNASITPFDKSGNKIDYNSLKNCIELQQKSKNGILLLGSTGENLSLSDNEKKKIIEYVCNLNIKLDIIVGVPSYNLNTTLDWINFCNEFPIDGYLITTPIYTKPGIIGQTLWFEKVLNKSKFPSMLYNIPSRAGIELYKETVKNLKDHNNFVAIKESSGSIENIISYKMIAPDISIFCGDDYMMPYMALEGSAGLVSVASNIWPSATRKYVKYSLNRSNKIKSGIWWQACKSLFIASNPIPIKTIMQKTGIIKNNTVRLPLSNIDLKSDDIIIKFDKIIKNWNLENES